MKLLGLTILLLSQMVFADTSVSVKSDVVVLKTSKIIYLKDLFNKTELEKFDRKTKKTLASTILAAKVKPGENLEFSSAMISKILRKVNRQ